MAIYLTKNNNDEIIMILNGCHNKNKCPEKDLSTNISSMKFSEKNKNNGCCQFEYFIYNFDINKPTPIMRMYLHLVMGRDKRLTQLIEQYNDYFGNIENMDEDGIDYLKKIILEDLDKDVTWKTCIKCKELYNENKIKFEDIIYIVPHLDYCVGHV